MFILGLLMAEPAVTTKSPSKNSVLRISYNLRDIKIHWLLFNQKFGSNNCIQALDVSILYC